MKEPHHKWEIEVYAFNDGDSPFQRWLNRLNPKTQARILERLNRLRDGNFGDCKRIEKQLFELRFTFESGYRIYFTKQGGRIVILLTGGDKRTQKRDIQKAKDHLELVLEENHE